MSGGRPRTAGQRRRPARRDVDLTRPGKPPRPVA